MNVQNQSFGVVFKKRVQSWTKHKDTFSGFGIASLNQN